MSEGGIIVIMNQMLTDGIQVASAGITEVMIMKYVRIGFKWMVLFAVMCLLLCGWAMAEEQEAVPVEGMQLIVMPRDTSATDSVLAITEAYVTCEPSILRVNEEATWEIHLDGAPEEAFTYRFVLWHFASGDYVGSQSVYSQSAKGSALTYTCTPRDEGAYRMYVYIYDQYGGILRTSTVITATEEEALLQKVNEILDLCKESGATTDYEIALFMHDYLIYHANYGESVHQCHSPVGVLVYGVGVCESYAGAYQLLMDRAGVTCISVVGTAGEPHGWNMVRIDGVWYQVDCTWDDPTGGKERHAYFLIPDSVMERDHNWDRTVYPACTDDRYAFPASGTYAGFDYTYEAGAIGIQAYHGTDEIVVVPDKINNLPVTWIADGCFSNVTTMKYLVVSEGIQEIRAPFAINCPNLKSIFLPSTAELRYVIYERYIVDCGAVERIFVSADNPNVYTFEDILYDKKTETLVYCPPKLGKTVIQVPDGVKSIGPHAFGPNPDVQEIVLPRYSLVSIGKYAFAECSALKKINIPLSVETIGDPLSPALTFPSSLQEITTPSGVHTYNAYDGVLYHIDGILACYPASKPDKTYVPIPSTVYIGDGAFAGADNLVSITLKEGLTYIGKRAFEDCSALQKIELPESVTDIGDRAFAGCTSLAYLYIPAGAKMVAGPELLEGANHAVIWGAAGSEAEKWANDNGYQFCDINGPWEVSGSCGTNLSWTYANEGAFGTLTISGTGAMDKCVPAPWTAYLSRIRTVIVQPGVTSIGESAFEGCKNLSSVSIPKGVVTIDAYAFYKCESLERVVLPDGIKTLGKNAFALCSALESINIPAGVRSVGSFMYCSSLERIEIPEGVTELDYYAFAHCTALKEVVLPDSLTTVRRAAFDYCESLTSVTFPENLTFVGDPIFTNAGVRTIIVLSKKEITVQGNPFNDVPATIYCHFGTSFHEWAVSKGLDVQPIPTSATDFEYSTSGGVITITSYTGTDKNVVIPSTINGLRVKKVEMGCFWSSSVTSVTFSEGIEEIVPGFAIDCRNLKTISLPSTARFILPEDVSNFLGLVQQGYLTSISVADNNPYLCMRDNILYADNMSILLYALNGFDQTVLTVPEGVETIYASSLDTFSYTDASGIAIEKMILPSTLKAIYDFTPMLREITVDPNNTVFYSVDGVLYTRSGILKYYPPMKPDDVFTVTEPISCIDAEAFRGAKKLVEIHLPDGLKSIGEDAFMLCSALARVEFPDSLTTVGESAFAYCSALVSVEFPESVTQLEDSIFTNCTALRKLYIPASAKINSKYGWLLHGTHDVVIWGIPGSEAEAFAKKFNYQFQDATQTVVSGSCGIYNTWNLAGDGTLTLSLGTVNGTGSPHMGTCDPAPWSLYADRIKSIIIEDGFCDISDDAFKGCVNLTSVSIPDSVASIGARAFEGCEKLKSVRIPDKCASIDDYAFWETQIKELHLPAAIRVVGDGAFPAGLQTITVDKDNPVFYAVDDVLFFLFNGVRPHLVVYATGKPDTEYTVPDNVTNIQPYAFADAKNLVSVSLPGVSYIDKYAFTGCTSLVSVTLSTKYQISFQDGIFKGCNALKEIRHSESISAIHGYSFDGCTSLTGIRFSEKLKNFYYHAFTNSYVSVIVMTSTMMPNVASTAFSGISPTIYCCPGSEVESWARDKGYEVFCLVDLPNDCTLQTGTMLLMDGVQLEEDSPVTWEISGDSVVTVEGQFLTAQKPGIATIKVCDDGFVLDEMTVTVVDGADGHEWDEGVVTTEGWRVHTCAGCSLKKITLNTCEHQMDDGVTFEPTCLSDGKQVFTCIHCDYSYSVLIPALGHVEEIVPEEAPTCTQEGRSEYVACSRCGEMLTLPYIIPVLPHDEAVIPGIPATHVTTGTSDSVVCTMCGEVITPPTTLPIVQVNKSYLPGETVRVDAEAFMGCCFECIIIGSNCKQIGAYAFAENPALRFVEIPASVTEIAASAFTGCSSDLVIVTTAGSTAEAFALTQGITCVTR